MWKLLLAIAVAGFVWYLLFGPKRRGNGRLSGSSKTGNPAAASAELAEARALLGVASDADEATIRAAHRRLVSAVHPDKGGSAELTRRVNAARDTLLRR